MVKVICDKCGADCDRIGFDVLIRCLCNFEPAYKNETGSPKITDAEESVRFTLCWDCFKKRGLPHPYDQRFAEEVLWPEKEQKDED